MSADIQWLTWSADDQNPLLQLLQASAQRYGQAFHVIPCLSLLDKLSSLRKAIDLFPEEQLVVCADAYDVLCLRDPIAFRETFKSLGATIIFGAEKSCFHHYDATKDYCDKRWATEEYRYPNTGLFTGFAGPLRTMLDCILAWPVDELKQEFITSKAKGSFNDQTLIGRYIASHDYVQLDSSTRLFWNVHSEYHRMHDVMEIENGAVTRHPKIKPCFAHFTQVKKYYPVLLDVAQRIGIRLTSENVDLELYDAYVHQRIESVDEYVAEFSPNVRKAIESLPAYKLLQARYTTQHAITRLKVNIGKMLFARK